MLITTIALLAGASTASAETSLSFFFPKTKLWWGNPAKAEVSVIAVDGNRTTVEFSCIDSTSSAPDPASGIARRKLPGVSTFDEKCFIDPYTSQIVTLAPGYYEAERTIRFDQDEPGTGICTSSGKDGVCTQIYSARDHFSSVCERLLLNSPKSEDYNEMSSCISSFSASIGSAQVREYGHKDLPLDSMTTWAVRITGGAEKLAAAATATTTTSTAEAGAAASTAGGTTASATGGASASASASSASATSPTDAASGAAVSSTEAAGAAQDTGNAAPAVRAGVAQVAVAGLVMAAMAL
ncbi:uncharacterized protein K452DRAFT_362168 [Aplosporella prunicola CBS 121167]|uniref:Uncharacterized protein n=1 Tax=Aplosporella prunicola CBS 121167 TaxID=1176127 RepID=A0A6A6AZ09_9PEZI|nr:uncharacterized protein K452DRAFT_362168 [Aplosporella prunicola CBS 121167]KAF2137020.1 hypothetical protein K452DRAFT_362168 [Aplosporella prunicola CBS 121167]